MTPGAIEIMSFRVADNESEPPVPTIDAEFIVNSVPPGAPTISSRSTAPAKFWLTTTGTLLTTPAVVTTALTRSLLKPASIATPATINEPATAGLTSN